MIRRILPAVALAALCATAFAAPVWAQDSGAMSSPSTQTNQMAQPNAMSSGQMSSGAMNSSNMSDNTMKKPKKHTHPAKPAATGSMSNGAMGSSGSMSAPSQTDTNSMSNPH